MRLHGDKELYRSGYGDKALDRWAERIRAWSKGAEPADARNILDARKASDSPKARDVLQSRDEKPPVARERDVLCYFDNTDVKLRAPVDAQALMRKLGLTPGEGVGVSRKSGVLRKSGASPKPGVRRKAGVARKSGAPRKSGVRPKASSARKSGLARPGSRANPPARPAAR
jgi:Protein of unknown function DUF72